MQQITIPKKEFFMLKKHNLLTLLGNLSNLTMPISFAQNLQIFQILPNLSPKSKLLNAAEYKPAHPPKTNTILHNMQKNSPKLQHKPCQTLWVEQFPTARASPQIVLTGFIWSSSRDENSVPCGPLDILCETGETSDKINFGK